MVGVTAGSSSGGDNSSSEVREGTDVDVRGAIRKRDWQGVVAAE